MRRTVKNFLNKIAAGDPLFRSIRGKAMEFEDSIKAN